jgi:exopolysaccharide production protein ExoZ
VNPQEEAKPRSFIASLQGLRFLAAGMVLLLHLILENRPHGVIMRTPGRIPLEASVDLFFIVSGFIVYYLCHNKFGRPGYTRTFVKHRLIRVVPLYWVWTSILILVMVFQSHLVNRSELDAARVVGSYLFLPLPRGDGTFFPIFILGWTLNFEMYFYFLFAIALNFSRKIGLIVIFSTICTMAAIGIATQTQLPFLMFYTRPITLDFLYGIMIAQLYLRGTRLPLLVRLGMMLGGFGLLSIIGHLGINSIYSRPFWGGLPMVLIAGGAVLGRDLPASTWWGRIIVEGGGASYSLYLTHMFTVRAMDVVWGKAGLPYGWPFIIVGFCVALVVASVAYRLIETPLLKAMRNWIDKPVPRGPADVTNRVSRPDHPQ